MAGYLDGEGCFTASPKGIRVSVSNCFPWTLQALQGEFGGSIHRKSSKGQSGHRAAYQWDSHGRSAIGCIQAVLPYLIEKRPQAALVLDYQNWPPRSAKRQAIEAELKRLKRTDYQ